MEIPKQDLELARVQAERDHFEVQLQRTLADTANMRRRQKQEMDDVRRRTVEGITQELLPVLDTFAMALHAYEEALPELMVMATHPCPPERYVLRRGAYDQPDRQHPVPPAAPASIPPLAGAWPPNRLGLAAWLNSQENPLSARVVVDRLWAQCFGRGLVGTPENFGKLGEPPAQPDPPAPATPGDPTMQAPPVAPPVAQPTTADGVAALLSTLTQLTTIVEGLQGIAKVMGGLAPQAQADAKKPLPDDEEDAEEEDTAEDAEDEDTDEDAEPEPVAEADGEGDGGQRRDEHEQRTGPGCCPPGQLIGSVHTAVPPDAVTQRPVRCGNVKHCGTGDWIAGVGG